MNAWCVHIGDRIDRDGLIMCFSCELQIFFVHFMLWNFSDETLVIWVVRCSSSTCGRMGVGGWSDGPPRPFVNSSCKSGGLERRPSLL